MVTRYGQADVPREVSGRGGPAVRPAAADFPRDVCLTVSRNHAVFLLYSWLSVVESDIYCWIWCHMFVKTVRTVRLRYAFTQIVMVRSHFHCRNTVSKYWYFSETTRSFQLASHPTQAAYGGWLETDGLTQVYTTKTTQITFFQVGTK